MRVCIGVAILLLFGAPAARAQNTMGGAWWPTGEMTLGRNLYGDVVPLQDGRLMIPGGSTAFGEAGNERSSVEFWNPGTMTWATGAALTMARSWHTATLLTDGRVLVAGGNAVTTSSAEIWVPATQTWSATAPMNVPRWKHTATRLPDGRVLVIGGSNASTAHATAEIFDPSLGTWSAAGTMATARQNHRAALLDDGRVLVAGGANGSESTDFASAEVWGLPGSFSPAGTMASTRSMPGMTKLADGRVLIAGGGIGNVSYRNTAEIWSPSTNTWTSTGTIRFARTWPTATLLLDGRVLLAGGYNHLLPDSEDNYSAHFRTAEIWDPATGVWHVTGRMFDARDWCYAHRFPDGRVLIAGGDDGSFTVNNIRRADIFNPRSGQFRPFEFSRVPTTTPQLASVTTDPEANDVRYELQWSTDPTFASFTMVNSSNGGFTNLVDATDTDPFTPGHGVAHAPALSNATTYWWRARFVDPLGYGRYSNWTASRSFTTDTGATDTAFHVTTTAQLQRGTAATVAVTSDKLLLPQVTQNTGVRAPSAQSGTWTNGVNALADGGGAATTGTEGAQHAFSSFGVSLAADVTVTGIVVQTDGFNSGTGNARFDVQVSPDGLNWFPVTPKQTANLPSTEGTQTLGGSSDLWSTTWTPAQIGTLQVRVGAFRQNGGPTWNLDWIRVTVHYTSTAPSGTYVTPLLRNSSLANANGRSWANVTWNEPVIAGCDPAAGCDATIDVLDVSGNPIPGYSGVSAPPISIGAIDPATYPAIRLRANLTSNSPSPEILDLTIDTIGGTPLAAEVVGLDAEASASGVRIEWGTEAGGFLRFEVLRAEEEQGPFAIVGHVIAEATSDFHDYTFDDTPPPGTWWYALDARRADGSVERVGPVLAARAGDSATPGCGCAMSEGSPLAGALLAISALAAAFAQRRRSSEAQARADR